MKRFLSTMASAVALLAGGAAQAALITFNDPGVIQIDGDTATYAEAGYNISGPATSFLLIEEPPATGVLVGGFFDAGFFSLTAMNRGPFALLGLDFGYYDLGDTPGTLSIVGLLDGLQVGALDLGLGALTRISFDAAFANVTEVRFSATSGFMLDNISAVPEPDSLALATGALMVLGFGLFKRREKTGAAARG